MNTEHRRTTDWHIDMVRIGTYAAGIGFSLVCWYGAIRLLLIGLGG